MHVESMDRWTEGLNKEALVLGVAVLAAGMGVASASFAWLGDGTSATNLVSPRIGIPDWVFWSVWLVNYPCFGIATAIVFRHRDRRGAIEALWFGAITLSAVLLFLPITVIARDARVALMMDVLGTVPTLATAWSYRRVSRAASWWLGPFFIWMPITVMLKLGLVLTQ